MHKAVKYLLVLLLAGIVALAPASAMASGVAGNGGDVPLQDSLAADQGSAAAVIEDNGVNSAAMEETNVDITAEPAVVPQESPAADTAAVPETATYTGDQAGQSCASNRSDCGDITVSNPNRAADPNSITRITGNSYCGKARLTISYNKCGLTGDCGAGNYSSNSCAKASASKGCNTGSCISNNSTDCNSGSCGKSTCASKGSAGTCSTGTCGNCCGNGTCSDGNGKDVASVSQDEGNSTGNCAELVNAEELYSLIFAALTNAGATYTGPNTDLMAAIQNYLWRYFQSQNISLANAETLPATAEQAGAAGVTTNTNASAGYTTDDEYAAEVIRLVNIERANAGLDELVIDESLCAATSIRVGEIQSKFSHTRPDGSSCFTALSETGAAYTSAGENIAIGQSTPKEVVEAWMNSPGHRANILNSAFSRIGVASLANSGGDFNGYAWAQFFAD